VNISDYRSSILSDSPELNPEAPTIIFCNPNAACYEYLITQSEFFHHYTKMGVNLVIWNYRGYGTSKTGWTGISMAKIQQDGEAVANYVRKNLVSGKVGVHGESLGGSVAAHIASHVKLDFVFVNRTFSSLQHVAYFIGGKLLVYLFKFLTFGGWPDKGLENF
jgi:alpha/beta superfamily hydrolase